MPLTLKCPYCKAESSAVQVMEAHIENCPMRP